MDDPLESNSFPVGSRRVPFLRATPSTKPSDHHRTSSPTLSTAEAQQAQRPPHSCDVGMKMRVGTLDGKRADYKGVPNVLVSPCFLSFRPSNGQVNRPSKPLSSGRQVKKTCQQ